MTAPELTVILPTYNEAANIGVSIERIGAALKDVPHEIIIVDDNSPDGTADIARAAALQNPHVRCIRRVGRRGLSGACMEGMMAASAPVIAVMDADLQHDAAILPKMLQEIQNGADLAVGTRYAGEGSASDGFSSARAIGSRLATALSNRITGALISDPMSGFFMLKRHVADRVAPQVSNEGFKILFDIVSRVGSELVIREVPFTFKERLHGDSKLSSLVTLQFLGLLVSRYTGGLFPAQFLLFAMVGSFGILVHMSALFLLSGPMQLAFPLSQLGATLVAMTSNFFINNSLTFGHMKLKGWKILTGLLTFYAVCSLGAIANISVSTQIYQWQSGIAIAGLVGALMSSVFNYSVTKLVIWRGA